VKLSSLLSSSNFGQSDPVSSVSNSVLFDGVVAGGFGRRAEEGFVDVKEVEEKDRRDAGMKERERENREFSKEDSERNDIIVQRSRERRKRRSREDRETSSRPSLPSRCVYRDKSRAPSVSP